MTDSSRLYMKYVPVVGKVERPDLGEVYEGEVPLSDQVEAGLKGLIGDGRANITVSRELSRLYYGSGGKVFVAVTLTCDQSEQYIQATTQWANHLAEKYSEEYFLVMKERLARLGIVQ